MDIFKKAGGVFSRYLWMRVLFVFLVFALIHVCIQFSTPFFADTDDSFYHAKMALMIWENGVLKDFPWLFFTTLHSAFVDHHLLFHVLIIPFYLFGKLLYAQQDAALIWGAKTAIITGIACASALFYLLLEEGKVQGKGIWMLLLLAVPYDFYFRLHMIRVQSYSLIVMLLGLWAMFTKRYWLLGILSFLYVTLYGGAFFLPIFVLIYFCTVGLLEKHFDWKLLAWGFGGLCLGYISDPYLLHVFGFLKDQLFVTGLGYQSSGLNVGGEWKPYDTWYIFQMGMLTFVVLGASVLSSFIFGTKQHAKGITVFLIQCMFLLLMWKSKRFVEYWPAFALLSAAYLSRDIQEKLQVSALHVWGIALSLLFPILGFLYADGNQALFYILNKWNLIQGSSGIVMQMKFSPLLQTLGIVVIFLSLLLMGVLCASLYEYSKKKSQHVSLFSTLALGIFSGVLVLPILGMSYNVIRDIQPRTAYINGAKSAMACIQREGNARRGDIVMTDDWDVFPLFFFYNHVTNYIVGLDPAFMYNYNKALYKQFADITMGADGEELPHKIKDIFKASFVVMDSEHTGFKENILRYPASFSKLCENDQFTVFRVR